MSKVKKPRLKLPEGTYWVSRERLPDGKLAGFVTLCCKKPERTMHEGRETWMGWELFESYWIADLDCTAPDDEYQLIRVGTLP